MNDDILQELKYNSAMMEHVLSEVKAVHELVADQPTHGEFNRLEQKVDKLSGGMEVVKAAVIDVSRDLKAHKEDERIHFMPHDAYGRRAAA